MKHLQLILNIIGILGLIPLGLFVANLATEQLAAINNAVQDTVGSRAYMLLFNPFILISGGLLTNFIIEILSLAKKHALNFQTFVTSNWSLTLLGGWSLLLLVFSTI